MALARLPFGARHPGWGCAGCRAPLHGTCMQVVRPLHHTGRTPRAAPSSRGAVYAGHDTKIDEKRILSRQNWNSPLPIWEKGAFLGNVALANLLYSPHPQPCVPLPASPSRQRGGSKTSAGAFSVLPSRQKGGLEASAKRLPPSARHCPKRAEGSLGPEKGPRPGGTIAFLSQLGPQAMPLCCLRAVFARNLA